MGYYGYGASVSTEETRTKVLGKCFFKLIQFIHVICRTVSYQKRPSIFTCLGFISPKSRAAGCGGQTFRATEFYQELEVK